MGLSKQLICTNCGKKYEKDKSKKNVKFCSYKCSRQHQNRKFYAENKEILKEKKELNPKYTDAVIESWA